MKLLTAHAREILGMPPEWDSYKWEALGLTSDTPTQCYKITGAVAPTITRGKNKGNPNWRKRDKKTDKSAYIKPEDHEKWLVAWEKKTGKCHNCIGEGQVLSGWSIEDGSRYKQCDRCGGSGKSKVVKETQLDLFEEAV